MSVEQDKPAKYPKPAEEFGLTEREQLYDRVSHTRFLTFLDEPSITIHRLEESYNNYGEYLFVTLSRPGTNRRIYISFWGLGYHEYRERWITDEWFWYQATPRPEFEEQPLLIEEVKRQIEERYNTVKGYVNQATQTRRGQVFEILADLTDEDGAVVEMEDLPDWLLNEDDLDLG
ncbi:hypothetical protein [Aggregatilinea lenta]|uniref:hypothetical protein n=1 Tax=Aggregatilinea lenta TaxID=913108 RepID=UPI000E5B89E0|nr:hypothetical protein [Aggregatilinea lenta]